MCFARERCCAGVLHKIIELCPGIWYELRVTAHNAVEKVPRPTPLLDAPTEMYGWDATLDLPI